MTDFDPAGTAIPPHDSAATTALAATRKHAKRLLKRARAGDAALLPKLREQLPKLAALSDASLAEQVKLADIQHALAREHGLASWAELKRHLEHLDPIHIQAQRFLSAIRNSETDAAQRLLESHPDLPAYNIHCACAAGAADVVAQLLAADATRATAPHQPDSWEPLLYVCASRVGTTVRSSAVGSAVRLTDERQVPEPRDALTGVPAADRLTPVPTSLVRCAELLLDNGASPNAFIPWDSADPQARLPALYYACVNNHVPVVKLLLERGADPNDGESTYHAAELDHRECLELLLAHGADISRRHPHWNNTPLYFLTGYKEFSPSCATSELGMDWLLEHGADPNVPSHTAPAVVTHANPATSVRDELPLHRAARYGRSPRVAQLLLKHGAILDAPRADGRTAYVLAVRTGNTAFADYLHEQGAKTDGLAPVDTFLGACALAEEPAARQLLVSHPRLLDDLGEEDRQALALAAEEGRLATVRLMAGLGFGLSWEHEWGGTPLHLAAWHGRPDMVRLLLELGAPVNVRDKTYGSSPLAWAAHGSTNCKRGSDADYCAVTELLLDAGADRETSVNKWNEPPYSMASRAVKALLRERGFAA